MYKILVVDDEPTALKYMQKLVELKCRDYEVSGTAANGAEAAEWLNKNYVDLVITDVRMPVMDGIGLVSFIQEHLPNVFSVVVSGYQDFEFVQGAFRAGVCDYLLKPIDPEEIQKLLAQIHKKLDKNYYLRRNQIFHQISTLGEKQIDWKELERIFPGKRYYAAIIRKNGMISRFSDRISNEVYSMENERVFIYGRDNMEMLYVYDEELIILDFLSTMKHEFLRHQEEDGYLTMVVREESFDIIELPQVLGALYASLDKSIAIGVNQTIYLNREEDTVETTCSEQKFDRLMYLARRKEIDILLREMEELFGIWEKERSPQYFLEEKIRYLFYEMKNSGMIENYDEYLLEDAFSNVVDMRDLYENIRELIQQNLKNQFSDRKPEKEEVFYQITQYIQQHPSERLSVQDICSRFGISQATLNRMFRSFAKMSYSSYLTDMRIQISRELLEQNPDSYIKDIAMAVGYSDQFYFSRIFHTATGMSPTEYLDKVIGETDEQKE